MALAAVDQEPAGQRAAPAVLDRVAQRADGGRLADDAMVETLAFHQRPFEELDGAVDRRAFLVAGDEEADRAGERLLGDEAQGGGCRRGEAALHVASAAAPELTVGDFGRERIEPPACRVAGRDDVGMAGEGEIGLSPPEPRIEVGDVGRSRRREDDELSGESFLGHEIAQIRQRAAVGRRHRPTADERARDLERGGRLWHAVTKGSECANGE